MALILQPQYSDTNTLSNYGEFIVDDGTGSYNATTNPGGYGTPNPDRVDMGLFISVEKKGYGTIADYEVSYDYSADIATTVDTWSVAITVDGWTEATLIGFPLWDIGVTYSANQAVYWVNEVYTSIAGSNLGNNPTVTGWTLVTDLGVIRDDITTYSPDITIHTGLLSYIVTSLGDIGYGNAVALDTSKDCAPECYDDINETNQIWSYLEGAKISGARQNYPDAERKVLIYTDLIDGKDCKVC